VHQIFIFSFFEALLLLQNIWVGGATREEGEKRKAFKNAFSLRPGILV
jgi:hypothetical protein